MSVCTPINGTQSGEKSLTSVDSRLVRNLCIAFKSLDENGEMVQRRIHCVAFCLTRGEIQGTYHKLVIILKS